MSTTPEPERWLDLTDVITAPTLVALVDVDALCPIDRPTLRILEALGSTRCHLVLYSREASADLVRLRVELPKASWLHPSSFVTPSQLIALLKAGSDSTRALAIGADTDLCGALDPLTDRALALVEDPTRGTYSRRALCSTLWSIVKLRYRVRETIAE